MLGSVYQTSNSSNSIAALYSAANSQGALSRLRSTTNKQTSSGALSSLFGTASTDTYSYASSIYSTQDSFVSSALSFGKQNTKNLGGLKDASSALTGAARSLGAKTLQSSSEDVATVTGRAYSGYYGKSQTVEVNNIATKQVSSTASFESDAIAEFDTGTNSFLIETDTGSSKLIEFDVSAADSNLDALNSMASSINSADAGVTARVISEKGESRLEITSQETGAKNAFDIKTFGSKTAAEKMEIRIREEATDASFKLNDREMTSESNNISLGGLSVSLKGEGSATLSPKVETANLASAAQTFVNSYNTAVSYLATRQSQGQGAARALSMITGNGVSRLAAIGIGMDENGNLTLDEEKLEEAAQTNPSTVKSLLTGYGGAIDEVERGANEAMRVPNATYSDFSNMRVQNSLIDILMPTGSIFDFAM